MGPPKGSTFQISIRAHIWKINEHRPSERVEMDVAYLIPRLALSNPHQRGDGRPKDRELREARC
jgi:hypothetical protein